LVWAEHDRCGLGPAATLGGRRSEVAALDVGPQRGVGVRDAFDDVLGGLRAETPGLELAVTDLAQLPDASLESEALEGHGGHPGGGVVDRG
jgi:hypothetical protein